MTQIYDVDTRRGFYVKAVGKEPGAAELMLAWEAMIEKASYADCVKAQSALRSGFNPMPDLGSLEPFLRASGHELAAAEVLKPSSFITQVFGGQGAFRENYQGLHWMIAARLLDASHSQLSRSEIEVLYSIMDRLLRGGRDWMNCNRVPTADKDFYTTLRSTKLPLMHRIATQLNDIISIRGAELYGDCYPTLCNAGQAAQDFLAVAVAVKNGHKVVTIRDAMDGAWTYASLFDLDPRSLPLVVREGRSGYENDGG